MKNTSKTFDITKSFALDAATLANLKVLLERQFKQHHRSNISYIIRELINREATRLEQQKGA